MCHLTLWHDARDDPTIEHAALATTTHECAACGTSLDEIVRLEPQPLPRALLETRDSPDPAWELGLAACPTCGSLAVLDGPTDEQIIASIDRPSTRTTASVVRIGKEADDAFGHVPLAIGETVIGLGAGDGTLLRPFADAGYEVVNVEPAPSRRAISDAAGMLGVGVAMGSGAIDVLEASSIRSTLVLGRTVLGRVQDPDALMSALTRLITRSGRVVFRLPSVESALTLSPPGLLNPEWRWFWTPHAMSLMAIRHGLAVEHMDQTTERGTWVCSLSLAREESAFPLARPGNASGAMLQQYAGRVTAWRELLADRISRAHKRGRRVLAVGASANGITAMNLAGLGPDMVEAIIDLNPFKQGHLAPGVKVPIEGTTMLAPGVDTELLALSPGLEHELRVQHGELLAGGHTQLRTIAPLG